MREFGRRVVPLFKGRGERFPLVNFALIMYIYTYISLNLIKDNIIINLYNILLFHFIPSLFFKTFKQR
jgi:hypothetical protein